MTVAAIAMMSFGFGVTWGGAALCIRKAMTRKAMTRKAMKNQVAD